MEKEIKVVIKEDLDARDIAKYVQVANQFKCDLYIEMEDNRRVSAKSIMGMMNFLVKEQDMVVIKAQGPDEEAAIIALENCLTGKE